jgi:hypothetical protein
MRDTKDEHQRWWHVRHPLRRAAQQTNSSYSQWRNAHDFLELIGSVPADYMLLFMNQS